MHNMLIKERHDTSTVLKKTFIKFNIYLAYCLMYVLYVFCRLLMLELDPEQNVLIRISQKLKKNLLRNSG